MFVKNTKILKYFIAVSIVLFLFLPTLVLGKNLLVPFTPQAPYGYWGQPWKDACEEAAILIVDNFYHNVNKKIGNPVIAKQEILRIIGIKDTTYGQSLDENADQITKLINNFLNWEATVVANPSIDQIKAEIDAARLVIVPAYGKFLKNPYFRYGGPEYHVVVISGYDDDKKEFITQEPGTRFGLDFRYSYATLMDANHDFLPNQQTKNGRKVMIFTNPILGSSAAVDGDQDGLTKAQEIKFDTITWLKDSDGDGFSDGNEVKNGFSPTVAEGKLKNGSLIKVASQPKIYQLKNNTKRLIINREVFLKHGWKWDEIKIVSDKFISSLKEEKPIVD